MVSPTLSGYIVLKHITNVQLSNYDEDVATQGWAPQARDVQPPIFETGPRVKSNSFERRLQPDEMLVLSMLMLSLVSL